MCGACIGDAFIPIEFVVYREMHVNLFPAAFGETGNGLDELLLDAFFFPFA